MFNRQRTLEVFGYDLDLSRRRRTKEERKLAPINKRWLVVVDNCSACGTERQIKLNQSRKNKLCLKCFHSLPHVQAAKHGQTKEKSEETKKRMREGHWSRKGLSPVNKGMPMLEGQKVKLAIRAREQSLREKAEIGEEEYRIKRSIAARGISRDDFDGFISPENAKIRSSTEYKAWSFEVLAKASFICLKCGGKGVPLTAHHKNGFNAFPEQRLLLSNGACLCWSCHDDFHARYGKGDNTEEQYLEWLAIKSS